MYTGQTTLKNRLAFGDEIGYKLAGFCEQMFEQTFCKHRLAYLGVLFFTA